ncbi:MAG: hypothetical protein JOZ12_13915 [Sinobacteraceae bacterium]|nr:hypothetical protein [Nevskiaceae bacterium]
MTAVTSDDSTVLEVVPERTGTAVVVAPEEAESGRASVASRANSVTERVPPASPMTKPGQPPATLLKAQNALARAVPAATYYVTRLGPAGTSGLAALVAAIIIGATVVLGAHSAADDLTARIAAVQRQHATATPEQELARVVTTLPGRARMPVIVSEVLQQATAAGVPLSAGHYSYSPPTAGRVARYELDFPVTAEYPKVRNFINRTLQEVPYATLDKLHIERKVVGDAVVKADVRFVVFVNDGAAP